jgi:hypothetical protein
MHNAHKFVLLTCHVRHSCAACVLPLLRCMHCVLVSAHNCECDVHFERLSSFHGCQRIGMLRAKNLTGVGTKQMACFRVTLSSTRAVGVICISAWKDNCGHVLVDVNVLDKLHETPQSIITLN